jgi:hypothetical protein
MAHQRRAPTQPSVSMIGGDDDNPVAELILGQWHAIRLAKKSRPISEYAPRGARRESCSASICSTLTCPPPIRTQNGGRPHVPHPRGSVRGNSRTKPPTTVMHVAAMRTKRGRQRAPELDVLRGTSSFGTAVGRDRVGRAHRSVRDPAKPGPNQVPTCAARRPVVSPVQPGGIWRMFLGLMAYLDLKGEGDTSMAGNQRPCRCVRAAR